MKERAVIIVLATSLSTFAAEQPSNWYAGGTITHNGKTETGEPDSSFGGSLTLGYQLSPTWAIETSTGFYGQLDIVKPGEYRDTIQNQSRYATDLSLLGNAPLSKRYKLYGGLGAMRESNDLSPIAQLGVRYDLSKRWSFNFGYKFIFNQASEYKLQSLGFGAQYHFQKTNIDVVTPVYNDLEVVSKIQTNKASKSEVAKEKAENNICKTEIYHVKSGDWLYKIASIHNVSFTELKTANAHFEAFKNINVIYPEQVIKIPNLQCP